MPIEAIKRKRNTYTTRDSLHALRDIWGKVQDTMEIAANERSLRGKEQFKAVIKLIDDMCDLFEPAAPESTLRHDLSMLKAQIVQAQAIEKIEQMKSHMLECIRYCERIMDILMELSEAEARTRLFISQE